MDILDELSPLPGKKSKTYDKRKKLEEGQLLSHHTLLDENLIEKVQRRLDGEKLVRGKASLNPGLEIIYDSSLYQGEDMEDKFGEKDPILAVTQLIEENKENQVRHNNVIGARTGELKLNSQLRNSDLRLESLVTQIIPSTCQTTSLGAKAFEDCRQRPSLVDAKDTQVDETQKVGVSESAQSFNFKLNNNFMDNLSSSSLLHTQKIIEQTLATQKDSENNMIKKSKDIGQTDAAVISDLYREERTAPKPVSGKKFTTKEFIKGFDASSSSEHEVESEDIGEKVPETFSAISDSEDKIPDIRKQPITHSPGNVQLVTKIKTIDLGSSSESDEETKPPVSKAFLLSIKARRSKKLKPLKNRASEDTASLKELYISLKSKNRKQIVEYKRQLSEKKGISLEQIELEKEQVEKLLEVELERNRKIRLQEKRKEKRELQAQSEGTDECNSLEISDVPDSAPDFSCSEEKEEEAYLDDELGNTEQDAEVEDDLENKGAILLIAREEAQGSSKSYLNDRTKEVSALPKEIVEDDSSEGESCEEKNVPMRSSKGNNHPILLGPSKSNLDTENEEDTETLHVYSDQEFDTGCKTSSLVGHRARKRIGDISSEDSSSEQDMNEQERENLRENIALQRRIEAKKAREKRKKLKSMGVTKMLEMEAEESEDEWHGIGGVDGENSEEYDSDLEQMFDDVSKANFNVDDIRAKLAKENKDYDERMINKILHDVKTGGFRKRGVGAMDIELSDDEDSYLRRYREKRRALLKERINENIDEIKANPKTQAFFESVLDEMVEKPASSAEGNNCSDPEDEKKIKISQIFVHESLSFLSSTKKDGSIITDKSVISEGETGDDMVSLRKDSDLKVSTAFTESENIDLNDDLNSFATDLRLSTAVQSFASNEDVNDRFKNGFKSVRISKNYRMAGSAKSAITFLGKTRKLKAPKPGNVHNSERTTRPGLFQTRSDKFT